MYLTEHLYRLIFIDSLTAQEGNNVVSPLQNQRLAPTRS
jgi:hypothetical protein